MLGDPCGFATPFLKSTWMNRRPEVAEGVILCQATTAARIARVAGAMAVLDGIERMEARGQRRCGVRLEPGARTRRMCRGFRLFHDQSKKIHHWMPIQPGLWFAHGKA